MFGKGSVIVQSRATMIVRTSPGSMSDVYSSNNSLKVDECSVIVLGSVKFVGTAYSGSTGECGKFRVSG